MADNLLNFKWVGINKLGKRLKGTIQAVDQKAAETDLLSRDIELIKIQPIKKSKILTSGRIKDKDIILFTRYLSTMTMAGLPIIHALDIISKDQSNETMRSI